MKLAGKALTRVKILPQLLLHIHSYSYSLTLPCRSIAGELHIFLALTIYVLLLKFSKRQFAATTKASFKISLSSNDSLCLPRKWKTQPYLWFWGLLKIDCRAVRGVARLDGARGKKQVGRPCVRTWGFSKVNVLYWRKYLWHCWDFSAPSELWPPCPPRYVPSCCKLWFQV